jgi:hypothetical protein
LAAEVAERSAMGIDPSGPNSRKEKALGNWRWWSCGRRGTVSYGCVSLLLELWCWSSGLGVKLWRGGRDGTGGAEGRTSRSQSLDSIWKVGSWWPRILSCRVFHILCARNTVCSGRW